jgi:hypothetical protein
MKIFLSALLCLFFLNFTKIYGQSSSINRAHFFSDSTILNAAIVTNLGKLVREKKAGYQLRGLFVSMLRDSTAVHDPVMLQVRGHFRKDFCYLPPLEVNFKYEKSATLHKLGSLKLVSECQSGDVYGQYLLKEFIVYKLYNLLTNLSFRVRLLNLNLVDSSSRKKTITEHAFLLEDIKDVAKRNDCKDWKQGKLFAQDADRRQMTMMAIFEYMIGNTDWGVPANHNTRLIVSQSDSFRRPFVVPYDFDYSGLVNTDYAVPDERFSLQNVQERFYMGFPRTQEELNETLDIFRQQKDNMYALIQNFDLLTARSKRDMIDYLNEFFDEVSKPERVKRVFIQNARR